jgi:hypothetical protein
MNNEKLRDQLELIKAFIEMWGSPASAPGSSEALEVKMGAGYARQFFDALRQVLNLADTQINTKLVPGTGITATIIATELLQAINKDGGLFWKNDSFAFGQEATGHIRSLASAYMQLPRPDDNRFVVEWLERDASESGVKQIRKPLATWPEWAEHLKPTNRKYEAPVPEIIYFSTPNGRTEFDWPEGFGKSGRETSCPRTLEAPYGLDLGSLREQASAWDTICATLNEVAPDWHDSDAPNGAAKACAAIRDLAVKANAAPGDGFEDWARSRGMNLLTIGEVSCQWNDDRFVDPSTALAFEAWKASRRSLGE